MLLGSTGAYINRNRTDIFAVSLQVSASRGEERYGNSSTFVSMRPCPTQSIVNHKFICQAATLAMHGRDAVEESADPFRVYILMMRPRETERPPRCLANACFLLYVVLADWYEQMDFCWSSFCSLSRVHSSLSSSEVLVTSRRYFSSKSCSFYFRHR